MSIDIRRSGGVECDALVNSPAPLTRPGLGIGGTSSDAAKTLLTAEALAYAAQIRAAAMKDKGYRTSFVGGEVGRFLRSIKWSDGSTNTLMAYETVLSRLSLDFAHFQSLEEFTVESVREFLDEHWGESSPATRRQRLAILKSFFVFCVDERGLAKSPAHKIKPPPQRNVERQAYAPDTIELLRRAQPRLREQIAIQLLGRLGLRRNELRLLRVSDFDLGKGTFLVHGKGGKQATLPIAFPDLAEDLLLELSTRNPDEYLMHPKGHPRRPMNPATIHYWFKRALKLAGLPETIKIHELRHSAADALWRKTGNLVLAQQLLRHESVATTQAYLHPSVDDLAAGLAQLLKSERGGD
ncbi:hypothetical protein BH20ACT13_BH20ACT13_01780 [soil metagenome]